MKNCHHHIAPWTGVWDIFFVSSYIEGLIPLGVVPFPDWHTALCNWRKGPEQKQALLVSLPSDC